MEDLIRLADLVAKRNALDGEIAKVIRRPAERSHIGEFIARHVFGIEEHPSANHKGNDGIFRDGPHAGKTVNTKFYGKDDGLWSIGEYPSADFYLVMVGGPAPAQSSRDTVRPLCINRIYLMPEVVLQDRGIQVGTAKSVSEDLRNLFVIYPKPGRFPLLQLTTPQTELINLFCYVDPAVDSHAYGTGSTPR